MYFSALTYINDAVGLWHGLQPLAAILGAFGVCALIPQIREEVASTNGRIVVGGKLVTRGRIGWAHEVIDAA